MMEREENKKKIILKVCTYIIMIIHNYKTIKILCRTIKKKNLNKKKHKKKSYANEHENFSVLVCNVLCKTKNEEEKSSIKKVIKQKKKK